MIKSRNREETERRLYRKMKAVKGNKVYTIDEVQQKTYQENGFDIQDDSGKVIAYGRGKTVPYGEYAALKETLEKCLAEKETVKEAIEVTEAAGKTTEMFAGKGKLGIKKAGE